MKRTRIVSIAFLLLFSLLLSLPLSADAAGESVTVDGKTDDTGWRTSGWTEVSGENGFWQSGKSSGFSYQFQFRTDGETLYAAVITDFDFSDGGNGNGTNVRLWFRTDGEADLYTSFADVYFENGAVKTALKKNTSKTENKAAAVENSGMNADADPDTHTVEFSVPLSAVGAGETVPVFLCVSNKTDANTCLYYPEVPAGTSANLNDNLPYVKWCGDAALLLNIADLKLGAEGPKETEAKAPETAAPETNAPETQVPDQDTEPAGTREPDGESSSALTWAIPVAAAVAAAVVILLIVLRKKKK